MAREIRGLSKYRKQTRGKSRSPTDVVTTMLVMDIRLIFEGMRDIGEGMDKMDERVSEIGRESPKARTQGK